MKVTLIRNNNLGDINTRLPESMNKVKGIVPILGLPYIAAYLENNGYEVSIIDALALNLSSDGLKKRLEKENPDIVGITTMTSVYKGAIEAARIAKELGKIVVLGGPHVAIFKEETVENKYVDYGIWGEGEYPMLRLVQSLENRFSLNNVPGLIFKQNDRVVCNQPHLHMNLDELPFPARHLLPNDRYSSIIGVEPIATMMLGRGCPYKCHFCFKHPSDKKYRIRSVENIIEEIELLVKRYKVKEIMMQDDSLTLKKDIIEGVCREIIKRKIIVKWEGPTRVNLVDRDLLKLMKRAGCYRLRYGVDTGDEKILKLMNKNIGLKQVRNVFNDTRRAGIKTFAYFIIGYLDDTPESVRNTINFAKELNPDQVMFTVCTPYPNTPLFDDCVKRGLVDADYWEKFVKGETRQRLPYLMKNADRYVKKAYREYYLRPSFIFQHLKKIRSIKEVKKSIQAMKGIFFFKVEGD